MNNFIRAYILVMILYTWYLTFEKISYQEEITDLKEQLAKAKCDSILVNKSDTVVIRSNGINRKIIINNDSTLIFKKWKK